MHKLKPRELLKDFSNLFVLITSLAVTTFSHYEVIFWPIVANPVTDQLIQCLCCLCSPKRGFQQKWQHHLQISSLLIRHLLKTTYGTAARPQPQHADPVSKKAKSIFSTSINNSVGNNRNTDHHKAFLREDWIECRRPQEKFKAETNGQKH